MRYFRKGASGIAEERPFCHLSHHCRLHTARLISGVPAQPLFLAEKGKFQEQRKYMDMYGADKKKKGFLTGDYQKRDEYSNVYGLR